MLREGTLALNVTILSNVHFTVTRLLAQRAPQQDELRHAALRVAHWYSNLICSLHKCS